MWSFDAFLMIFVRNENLVRETINDKSLYSWYKISISTIRV